MQQSEQEFVYYETRRLTAIVAWHAGQSPVSWRGRSILNAKDKMKHLLATLTVLDFRKLWAICRLILCSRDVSVRNLRFAPLEHPKVARIRVARNRMKVVFMWGVISRIMCPWFLISWCVPTRTHGSFIHSYSEINVKFESKTGGFRTKPIYLWIYVIRVTYA